jgi:uncharacterized phage protein gp47/JayE
LALDIPNQAQIVARCAADFRAEAGINPLRRSVEYALIRAQAGQSRGLYQFLQWIGRQAFPGTASDAYFWRWAAVWDISQKAAAPWQGQVTFTGVDTTLVPSGTELTRTDGESYTTDADGTIGDTVSGEVTIAVTASTAGSTGNNDDASPLTLASAITDVDSDATVDSTDVTGTDEEEVEDALVRLLSRIRAPSSGGGTSGDYENWALEVAGVTRAWESSPAPGQVYLAFVRDDDGTGAAIIPSTGEEDAVEAYVQAAAPITVNVTVTTLTAVLVNITISNLVPDTTAVRDAIQVSLEDFFLREAEPGGVIYLSRLDEAISNATGETSHGLDSPTVSILFAAEEIPILGTISYV